MRNDTLLRPLLAALLAIGSGTTPLTAQQPETLPPDTLLLRDLSFFQAPPGNWSVAGGARLNSAAPEQLTLAPGVGVLVNTAAAGEGEDLRTDWEHGDLDLELEFMVPEGSNSGLYFQGRYELQLLDSWRVQDPDYGDVGGIYHRWDESRGEGREGYEGYAPRVNAARAPGLWQSLRVEFRAPRFDDSGRKVANARFARVVLNGAVLHENIELSGPTRGSSFPGEAASGPLRIQGDHGPIAFRDVRYKRYTPQALHLSDLSYRVYEGGFRRFPDPASLTPARTGSSPGLTTAVAGVADGFLLVHDGVLQVPEAGQYLLDLRLGWLDEEGGDGSEGGARVLVGGREVLRHEGRERAVAAAAELTAGSHPFVLELYKNREGRPASFDLFAEGPGVRRQALSVETAGRRSGVPGAIRLEPSDEPYLLRSFVEHDGEKRTHVVSVGEPEEIHYSYDAGNGALLQVWRGPFLETTEMWEGRGEPQLAAPRGSVIQLPGEPLLAVLTDTAASWPDSLDAASGYRFLGYDVDASRRPTFRYRVGDATVEDALRPSDDLRGLVREIRVTSAVPVPGLHARIAAGQSVELLEDGSYMIDDEFYVVPASGPGTPTLRDVAGGQELLVPLTFRDGSATVAYEVVW